jgi:hypothetical protein
VKTTILVTESTFAEVSDELECRPMPEAPLWGKTKIPRLFEVLSARALRGARAMLSIGYDPLQGARTPPCGGLW